MIEQRKRKKTLPKSITSEEFEQSIKQVKKDKEALLSFILGFESGLRLGEICNLTQANILTDGIKILEGKGLKDRIAPLPKSWLPKMKKILPIKKTGRSLERNFKTACKKANLNPEYTFHSLRHGFAVRCLEKGMPLNQIQLFLGHANISTTSIYTKARPLDAIKSYQELF